MDFFQSIVYVIYTSYNSVKYRFPYNIFIDSMVVQKGVPVIEIYIKAIRIKTINADKIILLNNTNPNHAASHTGEDPSFPLL